MVRRLCRTEAIPRNGHGVPACAKPWLDASFGLPLRRAKAGRQRSCSANNSERSPIPGPVSVPLTALAARTAFIRAWRVTSRKRAIQKLWARAARLTGKSDRVFFEPLLQRERLGSPGVGNGIP